MRGGLQPERAARLYGAALAAADVLGSPLSRAIDADYEHAMRTARTQVGDEAFEVACREGRSLTIDRAAVDALEELGDLR